MIIKIPVTKFKESKAFKISRKIKHRAKDKDTKIFFKKRFKVKAIAKNKGPKNKLICLKFAWDKLSG